MTPLAIAALSFSMSADACAAAIGQGAARRPTVADAVRSAAIFGSIEAVTPLIGWALGILAASFITGIDHWIAFGLLTLGGGKLLIEGWHKRRDKVGDTAQANQGKWSLVLTAIGTSIDAAAVGVTLAFLDVNILVVALAIGATTFALTCGGLLLGRLLGAAFGAVVEMLGGLVLITVGTVILLEHTGYLR